MCFLLFAIYFASCCCSNKEEKKEINIKCFKYRPSGLVKPKKKLSADRRKRKTWKSERYKTIKKMMKLNSSRTKINRTLIKCKSLTNNPLKRHVFHLFVDCVYKYI